MIRLATTADLIRAYGGTEFPSYVMERDGTICACGGMFPRDGRLWAFFDVLANVTSREAIEIVRGVRRVVREAKAPVYVLCDDENYATAPRLLKVLGFEPTEEISNNSRVWKCQV